MFSRLQRHASAGWGLGLALVQACAVAHGGTVDVESGDEGTTFSINLPWDARPHRAAVEAAAGA
jgi:signal transduction histidine kinase